MVKPQPFKYKCSNCGYSKILQPKSDVLNPMDFMNECPKCKNKMDRVALNIIEKSLYQYKL